MKAKELITKLNDLVEEQGDLDVRVVTADGYVSEIEEVNPHMVGGFHIAIETDLYVEDEAE